MNQLDPITRFSRSNGIAWAGSRHMSLIQKNQRALPTKQIIFPKTTFSDPFEPIYVPPIKPLPLPTTKVHKKSVTGRLVEKILQYLS